MSRKNLPLFAYTLFMSAILGSGCDKEEEVADDSEESSDSDSDSNSSVSEDESVDSESLSVGTETESVGIDSESVGIDSESVGIDSESVGIDIEPVVVDSETVGIDSETVGIDSETVGEDDKDLTDEFAIVCTSYDELYQECVATGLVEDDDFCSRMSAAIVAETGSTSSELMANRIELFTCVSALDCAGINAYFDGDLYSDDKYPCKEFEM